MQKAVQVQRQNLNIVNTMIRIESGRSKISSQEYQRVYSLIETIRAQSWEWDNRQEQGDSEINAEDIKTYQELNQAIRDTLEYILSAHSNPQSVLGEMASIREPDFSNTDSLTLLDMSYSVLGKGSVLVSGLVGILSHHGHYPPFYLMQKRYDGEQVTLSFSGGFIVDSFQEYSNPVLIDSIIDEAGHRVIIPSVELSYMPALLSVRLDGLTSGKYHVYGRVGDASGVYQVETSFHEEIDLQNQEEFNPLNYPIFQDTLFNSRGIYKLEFAQ